jgi:hypothetical protein
MLRVKSIIKEMRATDRAALAQMRGRTGFSKTEGVAIFESACSQRAEDRVPTMSRRRRIATRQVELVINQLFAPDYFAILIIKLNGKLRPLRYW